MKTYPLIEAFRRATYEQYEDADRVALRTIGREWAMALPEDQRLIGATEEEIRKYEDVFDRYMRMLLNDEPFTP